MCNVLCKVSQSLFSSCTIVLCVKLYSYITFLMLVRYTVRKILQRIQSLSSLTNQNSHMLSTHIYAKCTILIDLSLKLNFHVHGFHCILEEIFYCFDCLRLNFYKFCLFLNFLFYFFFYSFFKSSLLRFIRFLFCSCFLRLNCFNLLWLCFHRFFYYRLFYLLLFRFRFSSCFNNCLLHSDSQESCASLLDYFVLQSVACYTKLD